jgi:hypothetical protein
VTATHGGANWLPSLRAQLRDWDALQREAWFFVMVEAAQAYILSTQLNVSSALGSSQQQQQQQEAGPPKVLSFSCCGRPWGPSGQQQQLQQAPKPPAAVPQWLPRLLWDADVLEAVLSDHFVGYVRELVAVLYSNLGYVPATADESQRHTAADDNDSTCSEVQDEADSYNTLLMVRGKSSTDSSSGDVGQAALMPPWSSPAVDAAVGALLKAACLHVAAELSGSSSGSSGGSGGSGSGSGSTEHWVSELLHPRPTAPPGASVVSTRVPRPPFPPPADKTDTPGAQHTDEQAEAMQRVQHLAEPLRQLIAAWLCAPLLQQALSQPLATATLSTDSSLLVTTQVDAAATPAAANAVGRVIAERAQQVAAWLGPFTTTAAAAAAAATSAAMAAATAAAGQQTADSQALPLDTAERSRYLAGPEAALVHVLLCNERSITRTLFHVCPWLSQQLQAYAFSYLRLAGDAEQQLHMLEQHYPEATSQGQGQREEQEQQAESSLRSLLLQKRQQHEKVRRDRAKQRELADAPRARAAAGLKEWVGAGDPNCTPDGTSPDSLARLNLVLQALPAWHTLRLSGVWQPLLLQLLPDDSRDLSCPVKPNTNTTSAHIQALKDHQRPHLTQLQQPPLQVQQQPQQWPQQASQPTAVHPSDSVVVAVTNLLVHCLTAPHVDGIESKAAADNTSKTFGQLVKLLLHVSGDSSSSSSSGSVVLQQLLGAWQSVLPEAAAATANPARRAEADAVAAAVGAQPEAAAAGFQLLGGAAVVAGALQDVVAAIKEQPAASAKYLRNLLGAALDAYEKSLCAQTGLAAAQHKADQAHASRDWLNPYSCDIHDSHLSTLRHKKALAAQLFALQQLVLSGAFAAAVQWQMARTWQQGQLTTPHYNKPRDLVQQGARFCFLQRLPDIPTHKQIDEDLYCWVRWNSHLLSAQGAAETTAATALGETKQYSDTVSAAKTTQSSSSSSSRNSSVLAELKVEQLIFLAQANIFGDAVAGSSKGKKDVRHSKPAPADPAHLARALWGLLDVWRWLHKRKQEAELRAGVEVRVWH